jgi:hypothetical protein
LVTDFRSEEWRVRYLHRGFPPGVPLPAFPPASMIKAGACWIPFERSNIRPRVPCFAGFFRARLLIFFVINAH